MEKNEDAPTTPLKTPQSLVKEEHVKIALKVQCGEDAILRTWAVHDFTSKGDNYACVVSSVMVTYLKDDERKWTSFVVKLNPCRPMPGMEQWANMMFDKEGKSYTDLLPNLNKCLEKSGQPELKAPKCYYVHIVEGNEVIYLEDLRDQGFKMRDRKVGLDVPHLLLIMKELGRFHAASVLFKGDKTREELVLEYPYLKEMFVSSMMTERPEMKTFGKSITDNASNMIALAEGYEKIAESVKEQDFFEESKKLLSINSPFEVICHGDCWTNNFLFKYDDNGSPIDIRLLDFQITRVASPCLDLSYMLYTSVVGDVRRKHMDTLLKTYLSTFDGILACNNKEPMYSFEELEKEFLKKCKFGYLMAFMLIPLVVCPKEEAFDFDSVSDVNMEEFMEKHKEKMMEQMKTNPLLRPRLLDMIDEMVEKGIVDK